MKRLLFFALAAVLFAACSKDAISEQQGIQPIVDEAPEALTVGFEGDDTRIQLNDAQKTVWTSGDLVSVFYRSNANQKWQYKGETGARTAELKRVYAGAASRDMDRVVIVYPYNDGYYINPSTYNVQASLPAVQTYLEDSYGLNGNIMISQGEYNQFSLKSVCGWLKLQLTGDGEKVKSITLRGNNGEQVAGELYINSADATSILASDSGASDDDSEAGGSLIFEDTILAEVTLDCGDGVELGAEATAFYIALPPQTFDGGITVEIATTDGAIMTKSTDNSIVIERNHIQPMTTFVYDGVRPQPNNEIWYTATAKVEPDDKTVFGATYVSNVWDSETGKGVITFEGDVTKIVYYAFAGCRSLTSVTIPNSVTTIGSYAFQECYSLTSVTIGNSVTTIEGNAFDFCSRLKEFKGKFAADNGRCLIKDNTIIKYAEASGTTYTIPNSVTTIGSCAFYCCQSLTSVTIPDSVTKIGNEAFRDCDSLTSVTIPDSVTTIGGSAFDYCDSLKTVYCKPTTPPTGGYNMFYGNAAGRRIFVPASDDDSIINAYKEAYGWSDYADYIFEEGPANNEIWYTNGSTTEPSMIRDVANFGANMVSNTYDADKKCWVIKFDGDVTTVGCVSTGQLRTIFTDCSSLTSISIPNSVTTIEGAAFKGCTSLTSITIPESVTEIALNVFTGCSSLKEFRGKFASEDGCCLIINGVLDQFAINCGATEYTIPDNVISIDADAFNGCSSITSITIPDAVEGFSYSSNPFYNCSNLKEFKGKFASEDGLCLMDDGSHTIISFAIGCGKTSYSFVEYNMAIGNGAVANCQSITDVACGQMIYGSAFSGCKNLSRVVIAAPTHAIDDYAFASCPNLTNVTVVPGTPPYLYGDNQFSDSPNVKIFVPSECLNAYKSAWSSYSSIIFAL